MHDYYFITFTDIYGQPVGRDLEEHYLKFVFKIAFLEILRVVSKSRSEDKTLSKQTQATLNRMHFFHQN